MILGILFTGVVQAGLGDRWAAPGGLGVPSSWRVLGTSSKEVLADQTAYNNDLIPGSNNTFNIGSHSKSVKNLYVTNISVNAVNNVLSTLNVTGNATLNNATTVTSLTANILALTRVTVAANTTISATAAETIIAITNATAVTNLTNRTVVGLVMILKNETGAGNASVVSAANIDGAASVNVSAYTPLRVYWNGTT